MKKLNDKTKRLQYIRVLEKFSKQTIGLLKHPKFEFEIFKKQTLKNYEFVKKAEPIRLNSEYFKKLICYCDMIILSIENHNKSFEDKKLLLLKEANLLHKEKNKNNYKKDKHKNKKFCLD